MAVLGVPDKLYVQLGDLDCFFTMVILFLLGVDDEDPGASDGSSSGSGGSHTRKDDSK